MSGLAEMVCGVMRLEPAAPAMEHQREWWTWADIDRVGSQFDELLRSRGLGEGTRIGCVIRNHPAAAALLIGVVTTDRCVVTLNPMLPDARLADDLRRIATPVIIAPSYDWARPGLISVAAELGCLGVELTGDRASPIRLVPELDGAGAPALDRKAPGIAVEMLTSGTTGEPKRVPLKQITLEQAVVGAGVYDGRKAGDPPRLRGGVQIINAPLAHISGLFGLFNLVASGRKCCILERFTVEGFVDAVERHRPKAANAPPSAIRMLLDANVPKEALSSLVAFRSGTASLPPEVGEAFYERYGIPVLQNYGATEFAGGVAGWTLADFEAHGKDKRGAVGRLNPGIEARVVDPATGSVLKPGEEGLLELRAIHLADGRSWLRTTDLAVLDEDEFLWINGRYDNAIIRGGFKIFPDDVVKALEQHPAIREAAVVGIPDARLGQAPAAAYIARAGAAEVRDDELREFLRERLLPYQVPVRLRRVEEFPRTPSLKVSLPDLQKMFADAAPA